MSASILFAESVQDRTGVVKSVLEAAAQVSTPIRLAAFAIAAVLALILLQRGGKTPPIAWAALLVVGLLAATPIVADALLVRDSQRGDDLYRLRVTVLGWDGFPTKPSRIWSSWGGEAQEVAAGWMFVIPRASIPQSGVVSVYASSESTCEQGVAELKLYGDFNPEIKLRLHRDTEAVVAGTVRDEANRTVVGARVFVEGHGDRELATTNAVGAFRLPAHATRCEQVRVSAEKAGYAPTAEYVYPGGVPISLTLVSNGTVK